MTDSDEKKIKNLLANGQIKAITLDSNIFISKGLNLDSPGLQAIPKIKKKFSFLLSNTVYNEVLSHLLKTRKDALNKAKGSVSTALKIFGKNSAILDCLIAQISDGHSAEEIANEQFKKFMEDTKCEIIDDTKLVSISTLFNSYFNSAPPFGTEKKKSEFPDALALNALQVTAEKRDIKILVVSMDKDWLKFCETSDHLFLVPKIEKALALVQEFPDQLRKEVHSLILKEIESRGHVWNTVSDYIEQIEFNVSAYAMHGYVDIWTYLGVLEKMACSDENEIDIIEYVDNGSQRVVASLPLSLNVRIPVDLNFSLLDAVDNELISIGARSIEVNKELYLRAIFTLSIRDDELMVEKIALDDNELLRKTYEVQLGEVDFWEPEDYEDH